MAMALLRPTPQVAAMRAAAMEGACGPWSTAATSAASSSAACAGDGQLAAEHQPDRLGEVDACR